MLRSKIYIFIIVAAFHFYAFSQQKETVLELIDKVENVTNKKEKLYLLDSLSSVLNEKRNSDFEFYKQNYPKYTLQYIDLVKQLDSFDLAASKTSELSKYYLKVVNKPDSALIFINTIIKDSSRIKSKVNMGHLYARRADANFQINDIEKAIIDYDRAEIIYHKSKDSIFEAQVLHYSGHTSQRLGNLTNAIIKYQKANQLYTGLKDTSYMAFTKLGVSYVFSQLSLLDESLKERQEVRTLLTAQQNKEYLSLSQLNVMDYKDLVKQKEFDKAEKSLLKGLEYSKKAINTDSKTYIWSYLSVFYSKYKKQPEIAEKYFDTIKLDTGFKNSPFGKILYWDVLTELEMSKGRYKEAIPFLEKMLQNFVKVNDVQSQLDVEKSLSKAYQKLNNFSKANTHLEKHVLLKDSLYDVKRSNSVIYYQTLYETEKRDSKIAIQKANIEMLEAKDKAKKNVLIFGGIGLSLLFLLIYLYRNRTLLIQNKKLQQSFLQELLQTQERVGKRISKDLHDSVGQSLLLIKNRILQNKDTKTAAVVDGVIDEVRTISRSLHPFKLEELGLTVTLQSSVEMIDENYDIFVSAEIDNIDQVFDQEKEVNIYRLVQESFNNIIKHSKARSAEIKVINKENDVEIIIKDNGRGFDVSKEKISISKIGLKTLNERSKFLKATFNILSEIDRGTTLIFNIPKYG